ncbi:MAG: YegS/Rv2252/BmrU family lipid kinase [Deltaproteobacteria bacterium]|nr:MAG: YegS/Rv2252/BmrU family lipid kinase [Deltaproteobacteria bacterium]
MLDPTATTVILNPAAAGGRVGRDLSALRRKIRDRLGPVDIQETRHPGHATELAEAAVRSGRTELLSLGGDGTHNEVVCGIMAADPAPATVTLGILPAGTGGDFRRNLAHAADLDQALTHVVTADALPIDLGHCHFVTDDGRDASRYFVNMASCGVSGLVCRIANRSSKRLGGRATFFLASLRGMWSWKGCPVRVTVDDRVVADDLSITTLVGANGRWAGGGMMFAPDARLGDGLLDFMAMEDRGLAGALAISGPLYKGRHVGRPDVHTWRGRQALVEPLDPSRHAWVEIDGEAPGRAPVRFEVVPAAIRLRDLRPELA